MRLKIACAAIILATATLGAHASEIYQWTDARGVTHYSETPPPAGTEYQVRRITDSGASTRAAPAPAAAEEEESPQCATARSNIEVLSGEGPVHQEEAGGDTRELDADERANQLELAQAAVRAYCSD